MLIPGMHKGLGRIFWSRFKHLRTFLLSGQREQELSAPGPPPQLLDAKVEQRKSFAVRCTGEERALLRTIKTPSS